MTVPEVPSSLLVVALGVGSAMAWGSADFGGGLASRRGPLLGVLLFAQVTGMLLAAAIWAVRGEPFVAGKDLAWSVVAGLVGAVGMACLYRGLQVGRMGVVAPVSGALGATIPVVVGIVVEGAPTPLATAGIVIAILAVILVSFVADDRSRGPSGLGWAFGAAFGLGAFNVVIDQVSTGLVAGPITVFRFVEVLVFVALILTSSGAWRLSRPGWLLVAVVGALDMTGNLAFLLAVQAGALAIASVLSSLYPVVTILLAMAVLRERINGLHALGIAAALVAIALIAAGSTTG